MNQDKRLSIAVPLVGLSDADDAQYIEECAQMGADSVFLMAPCDNIVRSKRAIKYQHLSDKILPPVPEQRTCDLPSLELAEHWAEQYALLAPKYTEKGITPYVWICHTIGHGGALSTSEKAPFQTLIGTEGQPAAGCFCPLDKDFVAYLCSLLSKVAATGVPLILLDDDFRLNYHGAVDLACFCPEHIAYYNRKFGTNLTREELADLIFANDYQTRANFQEMNSEIMLDFAGALEQAVHAVSPNTRLGLASCMLHYSSEAADVKALVRRLAGNTRPYIRVYGAPYHVKNNPRDVGYTMEMARLYHNHLQDSDIEISSEGDTFPHSRFHTDKTTAKTYLLAARCAGLRNMLFYPYPFSPSPSLEPVYVQAVKELSNVLPQLDCFLTPDLESQGLAPVISLQSTLTIPVSRKTPRFERCWPDEPAALSAMSMFGIPMGKTADPEQADGPVLLAGWHGKDLSDEALNRLLDRGAIVDVCAARWLMERGLDLGLEACQKLPFIPTFEVYDGPMSKVCHNEPIWQLVAGAPAFYDLKLKPGAEACSHFVCGETGTKAVGSAIYEKNGRRIFLLGFDFFSVRGSMQVVKNLARQEQFRNVSCWLGVDANVMNQDNLYMLAYKKDNQKTLCLIKTGLDSFSNVQLRLSQKPVSDLVFLDQTGKVSNDIPYTVTQKDDSWILDISKELACGDMLLVQYTV